MGETLGIAHNVFEKVEREKDRKERLKKYDEWQKEKVKKAAKIKEIKAKLKESTNGSLANVAMPEDLDDPIFNSEDNFEANSRSSSAELNELTKVTSTNSLKNGNDENATADGKEATAAEEAAAEEVGSQKQGFLCSGAAGCGFCPKTCAIL